MDGAKGMDQQAITPFYRNLKFWYEVLSKGYGLIASASGGGGVLLPWVVPVPKVLTGYMSLLSFIFFVFATFSSVNIRTKGGGRPRNGLGIVAYVFALLSLLLFLWMLDVAPTWPVIEQYPTLVRALAALPYGSFVGFFCAGLVFVLPLWSPGGTNE